LPLSLVLLSFCSYRALRQLRSFPTRRSSDLFLLVFEARHGVQPASADDSNLCGHGWDFMLVSVRAARRRLTKGAQKHRGARLRPDRKSTRLNSSHDQISYAVFCLKKKTMITT